MWICANCHGALGCEVHDQAMITEEMWTAGVEGLSITMCEECDEVDICILCDSGL